MFLLNQPRSTSSRHTNSSSSRSRTRCILRIVPPVARLSSSSNSSSSNSSSRWSSKNSRKARGVKSKVRMLASSASRRPLTSSKRGEPRRLRVVLDAVPITRLQSLQTSAPRSETARVRRVTLGRRTPRRVARIKAAVVWTISPGSRNRTWNLRRRSPSSLASSSETARDKSPPTRASCARTTRNSGS